MWLAFKIHFAQVHVKKSDNYFSTSSKIVNHKCKKGNYMWKYLHNNTCSKLVCYVFGQGFIFTIWKGNHGLFPKGSLESQNLSSHKLLRYVFSVSYISLWKVLHDNYEVTTIFQWKVNRISDNNRIHSDPSSRDWVMLCCYKVEYKNYGSMFLCSIVATLIACMHCSHGCWVDPKL